MDIRTAFVGVLMSAISVSALAGQRDHLDGLGDIKFGMPAKQAMKILGVTKITRKTDKDGKTYEAIEAPRQIGLRTFSASYHVVGGKISSIGLDWESAANSCHFGTEDILAQLRARYGQPDGTIAGTSFTWGFADGAKILAFAFSLGKCSVYLQYTQGGGSTF